MKPISIEISDEGLIDVVVEEATEELTQRIISLLQDEKFMNYMATKLAKQLFDTGIRETSNIGGDQLSIEEINNYLSNFGYEVEGDTIKLYNNSSIDVSTKNMSPEKRANYPLQLSLGKLIEYGFGYTGYANTNGLVKNWDYDVNEHGYKGWYYTDNNGLTHWTNGMEGRLVFYKTMLWLDENAKDIVTTYLKENL